MHPSPRPGLGADGLGSTSYSRQTPRKSVLHWFLKRTAPHAAPGAASSVLLALARAATLGPAAKGSGGGAEGSGGPGRREKEDSVCARCPPLPRPGPAPSGLRHVIAKPRDAFLT